MTAAVWLVQGSLPDIPQGWALVLVAMIGGPLLVWVQQRATKRSSDAAKVAAHEARRTAAGARQTAARIEESVGPKNGHGTVQDATGELLEEVRSLRGEVRAVRSTCEAIVDTGTHVTARLKQHDREIAALRRQEET